MSGPSFFPGPDGTRRLPPGNSLPETELPFQRAIAMLQPYRPLLARIVCPIIDRSMTGGNPNSRCDTLRPEMFRALLLLPLWAFAALAQPPVIPVGLDAYRLWERWPYQRIGARAYMRSTYDRRGGNERRRRSHFLYQLADDFNVTLDVEGARRSLFRPLQPLARQPVALRGGRRGPHRSGDQHGRSAASRAAFRVPAGEPFPGPLAWTWAQTKGADLSWVPIGFERSFRMAYSRTFYGTGYYIYHQFVQGAKLSQPIRAWDGKTPPDADVLELIGAAGRTSLRLPAAKACAKQTRPTGRACRTRLCECGTGRRPLACCAALEFSVPRDQARPSRQARLRVTWDGRAEPSIDAPVALFFGAGTLYNRDNREYLVKAFPMVVRYAGSRLPELLLSRCRSSARRGSSWPAQATCHRGRAMEGALRAVHGPAEPGRLLPRHLPRPSHARAGQGPGAARHHEAEGGGDWSGQFVGTSFIFSHDARAQHAGGRSALLLRRQPDAAGARAPAPRSGAAAAITGAART